MNGQLAAHQLNELAPEGEAQADAAVFLAVENSVCEKKSLEGWPGVMPRVDLDDRWAEFCEYLADGPLTNWK